MTTEGHRDEVIAATKCARIRRGISPQRPDEEDSVNEISIFFRSWLRLGDACHGGYDQNPNRTTMLRIFHCLVFATLLIGCGAQQPHRDPIPDHDQFQIESDHVKETRVINVWTPPRYTPDGEPLPVLYMPDGGIGEDFPHMAETVAQLVEADEIPPIILVGIENTERGRDLTGFSSVADDEQYCPLTDGAADFRAFIADELIPEIGRKYHITDRKGIIGESLAGLFVMETFLEHTNLFDFYIAMDPSLWWNDRHLVTHADSLLAAFPRKPVVLWYAGSSAEDISVPTRRLSKVLTREAPESLSWTYSDEPGEEHHTIFRATKEKALVWALNH